jgi:hypothetical protein
MEIAFWHWWVLGFGLLVAEMLLPTGFVLIWIGAAALIVGGLAWLIPAMNWQAEAVLFGVLSVLSFVLWKRFHKADLGSDQPALNRRGHSYVGRSFTLEAPIVNGVGKLRVDDSQWRIAGPDAPAGSKVRVVQVDGATLGVELEK